MVKHARLLGVLALVGVAMAWFVFLDTIVEQIVGPFRDRTGVIVYLPDLEIAVGGFGLLSVVCQIARRRRRLVMGLMAALLVFMFVTWLGIDGIDAESTGWPFVDYVFAISWLATYTTLVALGVAGILLARDLFLAHKAPHPQPVDAQQAGQGSDDTAP